MLVRIKFISRDVLLRIDKSEIILGLLYFSWPDSPAEKTEYNFCVSNHRFGPLALHESLGFWRISTMDRSKNKIAEK